MERKTLTQVVPEHPFPDYADWWPVGTDFLNCMSEAIVSQWAELEGNDNSLLPVQNYVAEYIQAVFGREARASLTANFTAKQFATPIKSGEFDALSYAFYRSAFELIVAHSEAYEHSVARERRLFTMRIGKIFFSQLHDHLQLNLPASLENEQDFASLKENIQRIGAFLKGNGYLRDHFDFRFTVDEQYQGNRILQTESEFIGNLKQGKLVYALYEMGYPIILPSAVYLYHTIGEAQHHSSRTIEELFDRVGYEARETDDFDPTNYPSDCVVELWEITR
ncbi:MAG: hypothetical protein GY796_24230 [Chloroflexi bacterium]|nr:hypothetical protein [Chloroflexota bacterium]